MSKKTTVTIKKISYFAKLMAPKLRGGEIFALVGDLGAGKTTFVKTMAKNLGSKKRVTSPTFTLMNTLTINPSKNNNVKTTTTIYHLDLYRIKNFREVAFLGITEVWGKKNTITFIEWADKINKHLPQKTKFIYFEPYEIK